MVLDANTLHSPSSKHSCHNVNTILQTINVIHKRCCQLALIATRRYAAAKLPNQHHVLLIIWQIVRKPRHIKLFHAKPINQDILSTSISTRKKKMYIRLTTSLLQNWIKIFLRAKPLIPTSLMRNYRSTL